MAYTLILATTVAPSFGRRGDVPSLMISFFSWPRSSTFFLVVIKQGQHRNTTGDPTPGRGAEVEDNDEEVEAEGKEVTGGTAVEDWYASSADEDANGSEGEMEVVIDDIVAVDVDVVVLVSLSLK